MTGKELYDLLKQQFEDRNLTIPVLYWEFLTPQEKRVWNKIAEDVSK